MVQDCEKHDVCYSLGAKAYPLSLQADHILALDCSGFVRWALWHATRAYNLDHPQDARSYYPLVIPDGSVQQHDWVIAGDFPKVSSSDALANDDRLRIAFLSPHDGGGIGHVMLIQGGRTIESHGHAGPSRRNWLDGSLPFMRKCSVYRLGRLV